MKFVQRVHYCPKCEKNIYFWQRTNTKSLEKDYTCSRCQNEAISFWEILSNKYIIPYLIGTPFFAASAVYGLWTSTIGSIRPVDIFIMIFNIIIAAVIVVNGMRYKQKPSIPQASIKSSKELKDFRKQNIWVILFGVLGFIAALVVDIITYYIWIGIASA
ncbi:MAG: hypothetical protein GOP50_10985 [Candidatus Heimdallarchaeota archaeon]|nr:hypothetical protein [Candidatus Heimdallarchaeota archaeon]